jgi:N-glycosylase/DNA lyase
MTVTYHPTDSPHDTLLDPASAMILVEEYRRRAVEVEQRAETVVWEEHRRLLLEMARTWRAMADQREWQTIGRLFRELPSGC